MSANQLRRMRLRYNTLKSLDEMGYLTQDEFDEMLYLAVLLTHH